MRVLVIEDWLLISACLYLFVGESCSFKELFLRFGCFGSFQSDLKNESFDNGENCFETKTKNTSTRAWFVMSKESWARFY